MQRRLMLSAAAAGALAASGCAGPSVNDYASEKLVLDLRQYFNGVVDAWGIFTDRSGKVVKRFTVVMHCQWNGDQGVLDEDFVYSDGSKQNASGHCNTWAMVAIRGEPTMSSVLPMVKHAAMPSIGATPWHCLWAIRSGRCSSTTGCIC